VYPFLDMSPKRGSLVQALVVLDHNKRVLHKKLSVAEAEEGKHKQLSSMNHTAVSADTSTLAL
jgi:hypothetical protein